MVFLSHNNLKQLTMEKTNFLERRKTVDNIDALYALIGMERLDVIPCESTLSLDVIFCPVTGEKITNRDDQLDEDQYLKIIRGDYGIKPVNTDQYKYERYNLQVSPEDLDELEHLCKKVS